MRRNETFRELIRYIVPSTISLLTFSVATFFDNMVVTNGIGAYALPALSICMPYMCMLYCISLIISSGTNVVTSILLGEGEREKASKAFTLATLTQITISIVLSVVAMVFVEKLAFLLGATEATYPHVISYLRVMVVTGPFYMLSYHFEELIKPHGRPELAPIICGGAAAFAIALEFILIFVFHCNVAAAAISLGISQAGATLAFLCVFLFDKKGRLKFCKARFSFSTVFRIVRSGIAGGTNELAVAVVSVLFNKLLGQYVGDIGILAYSVISSVNVITSNIYFGIALGVQTVLGLHFGGEGLQGCRKPLRYAAGIVLVVSGVLVGATTMFPKQITNLYLHGEAEMTIAYAVKALQIYGISYLFAGINILLGNYFAAIERIGYSCIISIGRGVVLISALVFAMSSLFGAGGIWWAALLNEVLILAIGSFGLLQMGKQMKNSSAQPLPSV